MRIFFVVSSLTFSFRQFVHGFFCRARLTSSLSRVRSGFCCSALYDRLAQEPQVPYNREPQQRPWAVGSRLWRGWLFRCRISACGVGRCFAVGSWRAAWVTLLQSELSVWCRWLFCGRISACDMGRSFAVGSRRLCVWVCGPLFCGRIRVAARHGTLHQQRLLSCIYRWICLCCVAWTPGFCVWPFQ